MSVKLLGKCLYPLATYHLHTHDTWEIILNLEGSGYDMVGEAQYPFFPGSIICIPPNMPHAKISDGQFKDIFIQSSDFLVSSRHEVFCFQDDEEMDIGMLIQAAYRTFHKRERYYVNIVSALYETIQYRLRGRLKSPARNQSIEQLIGLMVESFTDPEFELSLAIASLPYCKDYIRRMFRKETGMTPVSYLNHLRLEHAKKLLDQQQTTGYTIGEIALMCGFYDPRYFTRLFTRHAGASPMKYAAGTSDQDAQEKQA